MLTSGLLLTLKAFFVGRKTTKEIRYYWFGNLWQEVGKRNDKICTYFSINFQIDFWDYHNSELTLKAINSQFLYREK